MKKYTVISSRPGYMAGDYGQDTFMDHVEAKSPILAVAKARQSAIDIDLEAGDYFVIAVLAGHHDDLNPGR
jgi:hypothetical protein